MENKGLSHQVIELINSVFAKYCEIDVVMLFGSRAKGTANYHSDIDLVVFGIDNDLAIESIAMELDELPLPYKFDLIGFNLIKNASLRLHIKTLGIKVYEKLHDPHNK